MENNLRRYSTKSLYKGSLRTSAHSWLYGEGVIFQRENYKPITGPSEKQLSRELSWLALCGAGQQLRSELGALS